jgi:hypothetical protein
MMPQALSSLPSLSCFAGMLLIAFSLACGAQEASPPVPAAAATPSSTSASMPAAVPGAIPYKRDTSLESDATRTTVALLLCFGVLAAVLVVLRKRSGKIGILQTRQASPPFVVLYSRRLSPRASLHAVEFAGEHLLIAQSGDRITRLASSMDSAPPSRTDSEART